MPPTNEEQTSLTVKKELIAQVAAQDGLVWLDTSGDSMAPLLRPGDCVGFKPIENDELAVGDLFLYNDRGLTTCHRFLGWSNEKDVMRAKQKGDNISEGSLIDQDFILGKVVRLRCAEREIDMERGWPVAVQHLIGEYLRLVDTVCNALESLGRRLPIRRRLQRLLVIPLDLLVRRRG